GVVDGIVQVPLSRVAIGRPADLSARRDAEPDLRGVLVGLLAAREAVEHEVSGGVRGAIAVHAVELAAAREAASLRHRYGVRRFRPLRRRRLRIARPPRVRIRARNPWGFARLRFFGW